MEFQARHPKLFLPEALNILSLVLWRQVGHLPLGYLLCVSAYSAKACCGLMLSPWDSPFQSESQLPFPGSQNLPLVPSYLSVPLEDDQQALCKPGLFGESTYPFHPSSTPCVVIARSQRRFKRVGRQTAGRERTSESTRLWVPVKSEFKGPTGWS